MLEIYELSTMSRLRCSKHGLVVYICLVLTASHEDFCRGLINLSFSKEVYFPHNVEFEFSSDLASYRHSSQSFAILILLRELSSTRFDSLAPSHRGWKSRAMEKSGSLHCIASRRLPSHRVVSHRIASHRIINFIHTSVVNYGTCTFSMRLIEDSPTTVKKRLGTSLHSRDSIAILIASPSQYTIITPPLRNAHTHMLYSCILRPFTIHVCADDFFDQWGMDLTNESVGRIALVPEFHEGSSINTHTLFQYDEGHSLHTNKIFDSKRDQGKFVN